MDLYGHMNPHRNLWSIVLRVGRVWAGSLDVHVINRLPFACPVEPMVHLRHIGRKSPRLSYVLVLVPFLT